MLTLEQDVDRIIQRFKKRFIPGRLLREIILDWPLAIVSSQVSSRNYDLESGTLFVDESKPIAEQNVALCRAWILYRIHEKSGRPAEARTEGFVEAWVEEYLLPARLVSRHRVYLEILVLTLERRSVDASELVDRLAHEFCVPYSLAVKVLHRKGLLSRGSHTLPSNLVLFPNRGAALG